MDVNPVQPLNVLEATEVILVSISLTTLSVRPAHPLKALLPIVINEPGIITDDNIVHPLKWELPIALTLFPNVNVFSVVLLVNGDAFMVAVIFLP